LRDAAEVAKIAIQLRDILFPGAGDYVFVLEANSVPIVSRRFTVKLARSSS